MKKAIVYFGKKEIINTAKEAVEFINTLKFHGNSYSLECNYHTESLLNDLFSNKNHPYHEYDRIEIATTGCSTTRIYMYRALASTLEDHDCIVADRKQKAEKERIQEAEDARQEWLSEMYKSAKGWYIVTITGLAMKSKGNDGSVTKSVRVLADNQMNAYDKSVEFLQNNPSGNIINWMTFEHPKNSLIEHIGVWTDEKELEYC